MAKKICLLCKKRCEMEYENKNEKIKIKNNQCNRGIKYLLNEINNPKRILKTSMLINEELISVKSEQAIEKKDIYKIMKYLEKQKIQRKIIKDEIIIHNVLNTNINIIALKSSK